MRLQSIQSLRAVAAFGVLAFHAANFVAGYGSGALPKDTLKLGEAGVDIFFVISGVVLTVATRRHRGAAAFAAARLVRVGLPYWTMTLALVAAALLLPSLLRQQPWSATDILLSLAFVPSLPREGTLLTILQPGWSLSLEIVFYACLTAVLGVRRPARSILLGLLVAAPVAFGVLFQPDSAILRFYSQPILLEFVAGVALAELVLSDVAIGRPVALLAVALSLAGFTLAAVHPPGSFAAERVLAYGLPALLLIGGLLVLERRGELPTIPLLLVGGEMSYSLFLVHVVPAAAMAKLLGARLAPLGLAGDALIFAAIIAAALAAAALFHRLVERPATAMAARLAGPRPDRRSSVRRHPA